MRHIVLSDDGITLSPNALHRLMAVAYFPESEKDQEQGLFIAAIEQADFDRLGEKQYRASEITHILSNTIQKRVAQQYTAGLIAITMIWLKINGQKPSLNRSAAIVSCAMNSTPGISWRSSLNLDTEEKNSPATSDPSTLESTFRKLRSVAHIFAAWITATEYLEPAHLWDKPPIVAKTLIRTAAAYQNALERCIDVTHWNIWDVKKHFPKELLDWPFLEPGTGHLSWVVHGYEAALAQGLIKPPRGGRSTTGGGT